MYIKPRHVIQALHQRRMGRAKAAMVILYRRYKLRGKFRSSGIVLAQSILRGCNLNISEINMLHRVLENHALEISDLANTGEFAL